MDRGNYESRDAFVKRNVAWWCNTPEERYRRKEHYDNFMARHYVADFVRADHVVGEIGPGPYGGILIGCSIRCKKLVFIDYIMDELQRLEFVEWPVNSEFVNCPAEKIDLPDRYLDLLLSYNCLDHGWDIQAALRECVRISRRFFLSFDCRDSRSRCDLDHKQRFTLDDVRHALEGVACNVEQDTFSGLNNLHIVGVNPCES